MADSNPYLQAIESGLKGISFPKTPSNLYDPITYTLAQGGKRLRPVLTLIGSELFNGNREQALPVALAVELFHNFTLLHDDIMDAAPLRRGLPTVHEKWDQNIAILSGDAMMIKAYELLCSHESSQLPKILRLFNETAFKVCEGQQYDMDYEIQSEVSLTEYLHMIENKTSVLLGASLQLGALSAGVKDVDAERLYEFGKNIGIAFQLKDDWLDVYGDPEKVGKQRGGDILAAKKTYLMIKAFEVASPAQHDELLQLRSAEYRKEHGQDTVDKVIKLYNELNVGALLESEMQKYFEKALDILSPLPANESVKKMLLDYAKQLMNREL